MTNIYQDLTGLFVEGLYWLNKFIKFQNLKPSRGRRFLIFSEGFTTEKDLKPVPKKARKQNRK